MFSFFFYESIASGSCSKKPGEISGLWLLATATRIFNHLNSKYKYVTFYLFDLQTEQTNWKSHEKIFFIIRINKIKSFGLMWLHVF